jgi:hypothetical protein
MTLRKRRLCAEDSCKTIVGARWRLLVAAGAFALLAGVGIPAALATCGTGHQNAALTVMSCLTPDTVTNGQVITAMGSVKNNTKVTQKVMVKATLHLPDGKVHGSKTYTITLGAGKTSSMTEHIKVEPAFPRGTYHLVISATNGHGTSHAAGATTIK